VLNIEVIVMFGNMAYGSFDFGAHEFVQTCWIQAPFANLGNDWLINFKGGVEMEEDNWYITYAQILPLHLGGFFFLGTENVNYGTEILFFEEDNQSMWWNGFS
jgi:hypothetical protein